MRGILHAVSDDLHQPIDLGAANTFVDVVRRLAVRIANRADTPRGNATSFPKRFALYRKWQGQIAFVGNGKGIRWLNELDFVNGEVYANLTG